MTPQDKGRYLTLAEFADITSLPIRKLQYWTDLDSNPMPHEMRGGVKFVYHHEAQAWIDANVTTKTVYQVKSN